jgi:hypothetical protein
MKYCYACPYCGAVRTLSEEELWAAAPTADEPSKPQRCHVCRGWARIVMAGADREMTVEECVAEELQRFRERDNE